MTFVLGVTDDSKPEKMEFKMLKDACSKIVSRKDVIPLDFI